MIPKVIHYCWFGRNPLPDSAVKCIESWRKYLPDYEIKEWNEDNFDVNIIPYTAQAYSVGKDFRFSVIANQSADRFACFYKSWIRLSAPPRIPLRVKIRGTKEYAGMVELVDSVDLGSTARACRFESCCPHHIGKTALWINRMPFSLHLRGIIIE